MKRLRAPRADADVVGANKPHAVRAYDVTTPNAVGEAISFPSMKSADSTVRGVRYVRTPRRAVRAA